MVLSLRFLISESKIKELLTALNIEIRIANFEMGTLNCFQNVAATGMKEYTIQSRNLCRVNDPMRRQKLLHQGEKEVDMMKF